MEQITYNQAQIKAPRRMAETIADIMRQPPEQQQQPARARKRNNDIEIGG